MVEAKLFSLAATAGGQEYIVTLEEIGGSRLLPIWIGSNEGMSIAIAVQGHKLPRPLTHDLVINMLKSMGAVLEKIVIRDLEDNTFYADMVLNMPSGRKIIDARPSDAIAAAVRCGAPIFIEERVFEKVPMMHKPITKEEVEQFKEQLMHLKPEDFFKDKKDER